MTAAQRFTERQATIQALAERVPELFGHPDVVAEVAGRVCASSGYCGCNCRACLRGIHQCGHRKQCHKNCASR